MCHGFPEDEARLHHKCLLQIFRFDSAPAANVSKHGQFELAASRSKHPATVDGQSLKPEANSPPPPPVSQHFRNIAPSLLTACPNQNHYRLVSSVLGNGQKFSPPDRDTCCPATLPSPATHSPALLDWSQISSPTSCPRSEEH